MFSSRFIYLLFLIQWSNGFMESWDVDDDVETMWCNNPTDIKCDTNKCIEKTKRCDGIHDCADGLDEFDCDQYLCRPPVYYRCENKRCIISSFLCDDENDCGDFSDEKNCTSFQMSSNYNCSDDEWMCKDKLCISNEWVCNGEPDCLDGSDETLGCTKHIECDGFQCHDGTCILNEWHCDGHPDCIDQSDEAFCEFATNPSECTLDKRKYLCKNNKTCIPLNMLCDGKPQCPDKSDEHINCNASGIGKSCAHHGCPHECIQMPSGPLCLCPIGYHQNSEHFCTDLNECETYGICDQKCNNTAGSYECYCDQRYHLQDDKRTCKADGGEAIMIFSSRNNIRAYFLTSELYYSVASHLKQAVGVAFDGRHVYWTDIHAEYEAIVRAKEDGSEQELLVTSGLGAPEDLSVDWVTGNIYFTDAEMQHIGVCTNDALKCTVLINKDIHQPRGIALNPAKGEMYWSDWGKEPEIARSLMDGSEDISFVSNDIHWPNGLTIDYPNQRLYWTDAKLTTIESILLDGTDRRVILAQVVKHPYAIAVFEDKLYWSDWHTRSIQYCNKFTGKDHHTLIKEKKEYVYGLHIYHPALKQHIPNPCKASHCSDLCLLKSSGGYSCACAQGSVLLNDQHICKPIGMKITMAVGAGDLLIIIQHQKLGKHQIEALPLSFGRIDYLTYDSLSGSVIVNDQQRHEIVSVDLQTKKSKILMRNASGVTGMDFDYYTNNLYWCNPQLGTVEILSLNTMARKIIMRDLEGEKPIDLTLIPEQGIMFVAFQKADQTIHIDRLHMDGQSGRTHVIEQGLIGPVISLIFDSGLQRIFWSDSYTGFIEGTSVDGDDRHSFRSLLTDPVSIAVLENDLFWTNHKSHRIYWADKHNSGNGYNKKINLDISGEVDSMHLTPVTGLRTEMHPCLLNNGGCSHLCLLSAQTVLCDCPLGQVLTADNKTCYAPKHCGSNEFKCEQTEICIPKQLRCDGKRDCILGDDEERCVKEQRCPLGYFQCRNGECIPEIEVCDLHYDCHDDSDELNCDGFERLSTCPPNNFRCTDGKCISDSQRCDKIQDCNDGSDELNCPSLTCSANQFRCNSGTCIPENWECDHQIDCVDGSDEHENCGPVTCAPGLFTCNNGLCIDKNMECNFVDDCGDLSDERNCKKKETKPIHICKEFEFLCGQNSTVCVPEYARCNGTSECPNGEDEKDCRTCSEEEFECKNRKCISRHWLCDKMDDCGDKSDEDPKLCSEKSNRTGILYEHTSFQIPCENGFRCKTGHCIDMKLVCNGVENCYDGSDENGSCETACEMNNNPCAGICLKTPSGPKCTCKLGYKLKGDAQTCQDVNECDEHPQPCSQICTNTPGSFECSCYPEFILRTDRISCKSKGDSMYIIFSTSNEIRRLSPSINTLELLYSEDIPKITGLDVLVEQKQIYFAVEEFGTIYRIGTEPNSAKYSVRIGRPQKLALDWISENVYFIDTETSMKTLRVCHLLENKCSKLRQLETHDQVSALVVDAVNKYVFYATTLWWMFSTPISVIYRCNLDGSKLQELVRKDLGHVTGLTFDYNRQVLYFTDQPNEYIQAVNYDGSNRHRVLTRVEKRPIGLDLFEDQLYFLTLNGYMVKCKIYGSETNQCNMLRLHAYNTDLFVLAQKSKQPLNEENICRKHNCTHLCIPSHVGVRCVCDDGTSVAEGVSCTKTQERMASLQEEVKSPVFEVSYPKSAATNETSSKIGYTILELFIILILFAACCYFVYKYIHAKFNSAKFDVSMRFQNPAYGLSDLEAIPTISNLRPGQHEYANPVLINSNDMQSATNVILQRVQKNPFTIADSSYNSDSETNDTINSKRIYN